VVIVRRAAPLLILAIFFGALRAVPRQVRGSTSTVDCEHVAQDDARTLEACLSLHPDDVDLLAHTGRLLARQGDVAQAENLYRRALAVDPDDGDVHLELATLLLRQGHRDEARTEAEAAARLQPARTAAADILSASHSSREAR
jgi:Flp pilus assembly protein TadD